MGNHELKKLASAGANNNRSKAVRANCGMGRVMNAMSSGLQRQILTAVNKSTKQISSILGSLLGAACTFNPRGYRLRGLEGNRIYGTGEHKEGVPV